MSGWLTTLTMNTTTIIVEVNQVRNSIYDKNYLLFMNFEKKNLFS